MSGVNEGGRFSDEDPSYGHGKGVTKKADALSTARDVGHSALRGASDLVNSAAQGGAGATDYLKTHPGAALAATAGAGYVGLKTLKRGARGVAHAFRAAPKPPPSLGSRFGRAVKVLRGLE